MDRKKSFEILGLIGEPTKEDIRRAYINKSKTNHPDRGGNEEDFKNLGTAYSFLTEQAETQAQAQTQAQTQAQARAEQEMRQEKAKTDQKIYAETLLQKQKDKDMY